MNLSPQIAAAAEVSRALAESGRKSCVIGGLAVQRWGQPRFTQDADLTVMAHIGTETLVVDAMLRHFAPRIAAARQHALDHRVLLLRASNGVSIDLSLAALPFEDEVLERASPWRRATDVSIVTCTAEDLVVSSSSRPATTTS